MTTQAPPKAPEAFTLEFEDAYPVDVEREDREDGPRIRYWVCPPAADRTVAATVHYSDAAMCWWATDEWLGHKTTTYSFDKAHRYALEATHTESRRRLARDTDNKAYYRNVTKERAKAEAAVADLFISHA